jgi:hypothetical protein
MSAENQQERLDSYIAGYVDGEGSFHVAIQKVAHVKFGYQLLPEFHVSQRSDYAKFLKMIQRKLGGYIKANHAKSELDKNLVLVVRDRQDLLTKVIPFFEKNLLFSPKQKDFMKFALIIRAMDKKVHFEKKGFVRLLRIALSMNRNGLYRKDITRKIRI